MKTLFFHVSLITLLLISSCNVTQYSSEYKGDKFDISKYKTFAWAKNKSGSNISDDSEKIDKVELDEMIKTAITDELTGLGLKEVKESDADLALAYFILLNREITQSTSYSYYGYNWIYGGRVIKTSATHVKKEGTLVFDMFDTYSDRSVWKGWAVGKVKDRKPDPANVKYVIKMIFEEMKMDAGIIPGK